MSASNVVLIGMPGAGKSTIGVILAKNLKKPFADTDLIIQQRENSYLQDIINKVGLKGFLKIEEEAVLSLDLHNHIIATGGSVIYSEPAIRKLKEEGVLVYLNIRLYQLEHRLKNIKTRGVAMSNGQTLKDLYCERTPLYKKHADIEIDCSHKHMEKIISEIIDSLKAAGIT